MKILKLVLAASFLSAATLYAQDASKALKVGDKAKDFTLKNAQGKPVRLYSLLEKSNVILTWYRGGWCPYCNLALKQLQDALPKIKAQRALRSEEHTSELQSPTHLVCRLLLENKKGLCDY